MIPVSSLLSDKAFPSTPEPVQFPVKNTPPPVSAKKKVRKNVKTGKVQKPKDTPPTIINVEIPLSTHNDVHAEHSLAKLIEEKYGTSANNISKNLWNIDDEEDEEGEEDDEVEDDEEEEEEDADLEDLLDDAVDEEEEEDEDEDEEANEEAEVGDDADTDANAEEDEIVRALKIKFTPGMSDAEKEKLVLKEIHRRKMVTNKRIGKYDTQDPFIDDEELIYEDDVHANADGWFVWYGPLEKSSSINNKNNGKNRSLEVQSPPKLQKAVQKPTRRRRQAPQSKPKVPETPATPTSTQTNESKTVDVKPTTNPSRGNANMVDTLKETGQQQQQQQQPSNLIIGSFSFQ